MKLARVIPLYKSGDSKVINNYRPVSILSVFSKKFERVIYDRIFQFVNESDFTVQISIWIQN